MAVKRKRWSFTLVDRLKVIRAVEDNPSRARTQTASEFDIPLATLCNTVLKKKTKYQKLAASGEVVPNVKRARGSELTSVDKSLLDWFTTCRWAFLFSIWIYVFRKIWKCVCWCWRCSREWGIGQAFKIKSSRLDSVRACARARARVCVCACVSVCVCVCNTV